MAMLSRLNWPFSFLCGTSALAGACSSGPCGAALENGTITMATATESVAFENFTVSPNNDCPSVGSPTSLTINGFEAGTSFAFALCVSRPEIVGDDFISIGQDTGTVRFVAAAGSDGGCTLGLDRSAPSNAEVRFLGFCDNGTHPNGFDIEVRGTLGAERTCGDTTDSVTITLAGAAEVTAETF